MNKVRFAIDVETACTVEGCPHHGRSICAEGHSLSPWHSRITVAAVAGSDGTRRVLRGTAKEITSHIREILEAYPDATVVGQNFKFDLLHIARHGYAIPLERWVGDSQVAAYVCTEKIPDSWLADYEAKRQERGALHRKSGKHSLKTLAPYFLGVEPFWEPADGNLDDDEYVLKDATYTLALTEKLEERLRELDQFDFYKERQLPWVKMLLEAEWRGIKLDMEGLRATEAAYKAKALSLRTKLDEQWADAHQAYISGLKQELHAKYQAMAAKAKQPMNYGSRYWKLYEAAREKLHTHLDYDSPKQMAWLLRDYYGYDITSLEGEESTGREVLERLSEEGKEDVKTYLEWRKANKILTAFLPTYSALATDGLLHPIYNPTTTRTGRTSSERPNCLSLDTEVLTPAGFRRYDQLKAGDPIAVYDAETGTTRFEPALAIYLSPLQEHEMVTVQNQHVDWSMTANHRCPIVQKRSGKLRVVRADEINPSASMKVLHGAPCTTYTTPVFDSIAVLQLVVAAQADAWVKGSSLNFGLKRERKIARLREILQKLGWEHSEIAREDGETRFYIRDGVTKLASWLSSAKEFTPAVLQMSSEERAAFLEELKHWDGLSTRPGYDEYTTAIKHNADAVQTLACLSGLRAHMRTTFVGKRAYYRVSFTARVTSYLSNAKIEKVTETNQVWCARVSTGFFVARRGSDTFITGNCQQVPPQLRPLFKARPGYSFIGYDAGAIEAKLIALYSEDETLYNLISTGTSLHDFNTVNFFELPTEELEHIKTKYPQHRKAAKNVGFALFYNAGPNRLRIAMAQAGFIISLDQARRMHKRFKESFAGAYAAGQDVVRYFEEGGVYKNLLGRPLRIENPDDAYMQGFNTLIQSSASDLNLHGAHLAYQEFKSLGLDATPLLFVHDFVCFEVKDEHVAEADAILQRCLTGFDLQTKHGPITLTIEGGVMSEWSK